MSRVLDGVRALLAKTPRWVGLVIAALIAVVIIAVTVALVSTSRSAWYGSYADLANNYENLQDSVHADLRCEQCHYDERGPFAHEVALVGEFYGDLVAPTEDLRFVQMATPTREACLTCHHEDWSDNASRTVKIPHPAHLRVADVTDECVECHKWTGHDEVYIERHKEMPFSSVCASFDCHAGWKSTQECGDCHHVVQEDAGDWRVVHKETVRLAGPNGCLEACHDADQCRQCHTTGKRPDFPKDAPGTTLKALEREHVKDDWMQKHGAAGLADEEACFTCHVSAAECEDCHSERPEFHGLKGTWLNRHAEFASDMKDGKSVPNPDKEKRCLVCHERQYCDDCHEQFEEMR